VAGGPAVPPPEPVRPLAVQVPNELTTNAGNGWTAVEVELVVPASGNVGLLGRQLWLGRRLAGKTITVWADQHSIHLRLDGQLLKTVPSRYDPEHLARLARLPGARQGGPPPGPAAAGTPAAGQLVQVTRAINATGCLHLGGRVVGIGSRFAGQLATVHLTDQLVHISVAGQLVKTLASHLSPEARGRLQGAVRAGPLPTVADEPVTIQRRVGERGNVQVAGQRLQVGLGHARKLVTIHADETVVRVYDSNHALLKTIPRTARKEVTHFKASTTKHTPSTF
jgi:hypothetical protein